MSVIIKKINDVVVEPIPIKVDTRPVKGGEIVPEVFSNIYLCAKKKSGKTSALRTILNKCCDKNTTIFAFVATLNNDKGWVKIREELEDKGIEFNGFTYIKKDGVDELKDIIEQMKEIAEDEENKKREKKNNKVEKTLDIMELMCREQGIKTATQVVEEQEKEDNKKEKKSKWQVQDYIFIFDDMSSELKVNSLMELLKENRHFKCKVIISSQWLNDIKPEMIKMLDLLILFGGFSAIKLKELYDGLGIDVPEELFYKMYEKATEKKHGFFYIDAVNIEFRRNFNEKFIIPDKDKPTLFPRKDMIKEIDSEKEQKLWHWKNKSNS